MVRSRSHARGEGGVCRLERRKREHSGSHRAHVLSLYIFVTSVATPIGALLWGVVADWLNIDATLGAAGVLLMLGIGAGLISILRHEGAAAPAADSEMAETTPG